MWWLYRTLALLLAPLWLAALAFKQRGAARVLERLGRAAPRTDNPLWIQAVSAGEVRIALRLAERLQVLGLPVVLSSTTSAGLALAEREGHERLTPRAFPLDLPFCARSALRALSPRALVMVETELWPALFREARSRGVPVFIVNGRLSERAFSRTLKLKSLYGSAIQGVRVAAQSEEHAARFKLLGAYPGHVQILGNLKYDLVPPPHFEQTRAELKALLPSDPVWVAGSVREGEEDLVLRAFVKVREQVPASRLILAPRHVGRASLCVDTARARGFTAMKRSAPTGSGWDVLVLDTVGELWSAYDLGRAAFVGGSLVPLGGQNILEPAFLGKPVLFGPSMENFKEEAERLLASGGAFRVESPEELGWRMASFLADPDLAAAAGRRALSALEHHRGAVDRAARWLADALPEP